MRNKLVLALILFGGLTATVVLRSGGAPANDDKSPSPPTPQVSGRLLAIVHGDTSTLRCEYDASVLADDEKVISVNSAKAGLEIAAGDSVDYPDEESPDRVMTTGPQEIMVTADQGRLRQGCAPESVVYLEDGGQISLEQFIEQLGAR